MSAAEGALGPALVQWNDYVGTAAADECDTGTGSPSLYEMAGLDPRLWTIVTVDIAIAAGPTHAITVYAFDRLAHGVRCYADMLEFAGHAGELPVTAFCLDPELDITHLAGVLFQQLLVRLTARGVSDQRLSVQEQRAAAPGSVDARAQPDL